MYAIFCCQDCIASSAAAEVLPPLLIFPPGLSNLHVGLQPCSWQCYSGDGAALEELRDESWIGLLNPAVVNSRVPTCLMSCF